MTEDGCICYVPRKFSEEKLRLIGRANAIISHYDKMGYSLTVRSLYYKGVTENLFPNTVQSYNRFASLINDARLAGLVSWTAIEDNLRVLEGVPHVANVRASIQGARDVYARDLWQDQEWRPEVWVEKDAMVGVIQNICNRLRVNFFACRGYTSQSAMWRAGQRLASYVQKGQRPIIFHFGDHDPSGIDMSRDNAERLSMFAGIQIKFVRLALNMNQVEHYNLPPNPAKVTDSRFEGYRAKHGEESWELDAYDPEHIGDLIEENVAMIRDEGKWEVALAQESEDKDQLDVMLEEI